MNVRSAVLGQGAAALAVRHQLSGYRTFAARVVTLHTDMMPSVGDTTNELGFEAPSETPSEQTLRAHANLLLNPDESSTGLTALRKLRFFASFISLEHRDRSQGAASAMEDYIEAILTQSVYVLGSCRVH